jgi:hypothetical protein
MRPSPEGQDAVDFAFNQRWKLTYSSHQNTPMKINPRGLIAACLALILGFPATHYADAVLRTGSGATPAGIQGIVSQFQSDLGGVNNGIGGGPFSSGFRAINWDGVPDGSAAPNNLPGTFFNSTSPRGIVFTTPGGGFQVSARSSSGTPVNFGNIDPSYSSTFQTFSPERLFTALNSIIININFFLPGTPTMPAYVRGFGAVFTDVDMSGSASIELFDQNNQSLFAGSVPVSTNGGLSFLGISFNAGEQIHRATITSGAFALGAGMVDGAPFDLVVMDDWFYGEPQAVPEPATLTLLAFGLILLASLRRWQRHRVMHPDTVEPQPRRRS